MTMPTEYIPGVCNIGADEIRYRRNWGIGGTIATIAAFVLLLAVDAAPAWFLLLFIPAAGAAIGFIQARARFCVHFGRAGLFNFGTKGTTETVAAAAARRADRARARQLTLRAALHGAAVALAAFALALIVNA
ncbi:MAG: hypothetical protein ACWA6X_05560 [Bauldia sp.]